MHVIPAPNCDHLVVTLNLVQGQEGHNGIYKLTNFVGDELGEIDFDENGPKSLWMSASDMIKESDSLPKNTRLKLLYADGSEVPPPEGQGKHFCTQNLEAQQTHATSYSFSIDIESNTSVTIFAVNPMLHCSTTFKFQITNQKSNQTRIAIVMGCGSHKSLVWSAAGAR